MSTPAKLVSPGYVINGTMSVTKSELYFEMDDDDEENKKIDPKVRLLFYRWLAVGKNTLCQVGVEVRTKRVDDLKGMKGA